MITSSVTGMKGRGHESMETRRQPLGRQAHRCAKGRGQGKKGQEGTVVSDHSWQEETGRDGGGKLTDSCDKEHFKDFKDKSTHYSRPEYLTWRNNGRRDSQNGIKGRSTPTYNCNYGRRDSGRWGAEIFIE